MKTTPIPHQIDQLITYANDIHGGLKKHDVELGLVQNPAAKLLPIIDAAKKAENAFQASRALPEQVLPPAQTAADDAGKKFIMNAKKVLRAKWGAILG